MSQEAQAITLSVPAVDIPIWLLDRRKLGKDWGKKLKAVQSKYDKVIESISSKPSLSNIQGFMETHKGGMRLKEWLEVEKMLIESEEGKARNLFGQYSSPLIKDVRLIIAMLKKDNLYLADIGKEITDRIQFEMYFFRSVTAATNKK